MPKFKVMHTIHEQTKDRELEKDTISVIVAEDMGKAIKIVKDAVEMSLVDQSVVVSVRAIPIDK